VHSWDAHTILSLEGVVTVILERLTPGRRQTHPTILELRIQSPVPVFGSELRALSARARAHGRRIYTHVYIHARTGRHALVAKMSGLQNEPAAVSSSISIHIVSEGECVSGREKERVLRGFVRAAK
jgi:hypothetical protein